MGTMRVTTAHSQKLRKAIVDNRVRVLGSGEKDKKKLKGEFSFPRSQRIEKSSKELLMEEVQRNPANDAV